MSIIPGLVFSRARWKLIRERNRTMDREVYLDNDHLVDYRVEERTTGLHISDLQLTASLSRNPTGSAIRSFFLGGETSSFVAAEEFVVGTSIFLSGSVTLSVLTVASQSLFTTFSNENQGGVILAVTLSESPACSGHYIGTFAGADISTALSQSLSSSFSSSVSESVESASFDTAGLIVSAGVTTSVAFTASISGFTSSITESNLLPLQESDDRCFGVFEVIESGSFYSGSFKHILKTSTPMTLRSVRFIS